MLKHLSIQNYALIRSLDIDFQQGFTVITGETGAGKSILLGALGLLLGKRADPTVLLDKDKKCVVEGVFDLSRLKLQNFFETNDLDYDEKECLLRREIIPSGRSRAFINDTPVNLDVLKTLGDALVDIHSQHQTLLLNQPQFQLDVLDSFVNEPQLLDNYRRVFTRHDTTRRRLEELKQREQSLRQDEDYLRFQLNELQAAQLDEETAAGLVEKEKFLSHAEEVISGLSKAAALLSGEEFSALNQVNEALAALRHISGFFAPADELAQRLESLQIELQDIAAETEAEQGRTSFDPGELQAVTEALDLIYRLQQKHGVQSVGELITLRDELAERLQSSQSLAEEIRQLEEEEKTLFDELRSAASRLHQSRAGKAPEFCDAVTDVLTRLGMKDAVFQVEITPMEQFGPNGNDQVRFLFNANKGGRPDEISRIASGGELSRLMLAIKSLINKQNLLPTVVFDEIDAGVSGEIAARVGNILRQMAGNHQLIVISHLPQIASRAHWHFRVTKAETDGKVSSRITLLDDEGRVDEIAKMMSDEQVSQAAIETARTLLGHAG